MKENLNRTTKVSYFDINGTKFRISAVTLRRLSKNLKTEIYKYYKLTDYDNFEVRNLKIIIDLSDLRRLITNNIK